MTIGLSEEKAVQTLAFTNSVRRYRQAKGQYGTWEMMCGAPPQISDAMYRQVLTQINGQYAALEEACEAQKPSLDVRLRAEQLLRTSIQPYISSILESLMEPTSRGFSEVRDVFFKEIVEISKNSLNGRGQEKLGEQLERLSMLAFHPMKMHSCYEKMEQLNLEGLQQRFDVSSPSVFISRAEILMREGEEDLCKSIQKCQDRVLKVNQLQIKIHLLRFLGKLGIKSHLCFCQKYDYDSSTVRKRFFREALLQIIIPYMLQQLAPSCAPELPRFQELIFEDLSRFLLVENMYEEVVLQSVSNDIMMGLFCVCPAVKEAAVQRRHNLYRDSIILTNSDPNLHLLEETPPVDWGSKFGADDPDGSVGSRAEGKGLGGRRRQVVSMIQLEGLPIPYESCLEVPGVDLIPEEDGEVPEVKRVNEEDLGPLEDPKSPDSVDAIRDLISPVVEVVLPVPEEKLEDVTSGTETTKGTITMEDGLQEEVTHVTTIVEDSSRKSLRDKSSPQSILQELVGSRKQKELQEEAAILKALEEMEMAVQEEDSEQIAEVSTAESDSELQPLATDCSSRNDSSFQSPSNQSEPEPITNGPTGQDKITDPVDVELLLV
ncbi:hypothetical protein GOODEAATRI_010619 [Goodea atripinnis]|uniref:Niban 1/2/3 domain-containing protein n=1 Tax=Goodea atripinnis TaxID=208336 RepID=A0ABV0N9J9_9TELE